MSTNQIIMSDFGINMHFIVFSKSFSRNPRQSVVEPLGSAEPTLGTSAIDVWTHVIGIFTVSIPNANLTEHLSKSPGLAAFLFGIF